jgi:tetratricopeptide (TPR) repeat protein
MKNPDPTEVHAQVSEEQNAILYGLRVLDIADCFKRADYKGMLQAAKQAVHLKPDSADAHCHLGNAYALVHYDKEAEKELMMAINLDPSHDGAFYALGLFCLDLDRDLKTALHGYPRFA